MGSPVLRLKSHTTGARPMAWAQIEVENNRVRRIAMPTSGLACKYQLRGTGCRAGLRSDFTMKEVRPAVQRKLFVALIEKAQTHAEPPGLFHRGKSWDRKQESRWSAQN